MSEATLSPRVHTLLSGLDAWSTRGAVRAIVVKVVVTVAGPWSSWRASRCSSCPGPACW